MSDRTIIVDLGVDDWHIPEARAYRKAVGVNPEYAAVAIEGAFSEAQKQARAEFGDAVDEDGWETPEDWLPKVLFNFEPDYLLGFAWIPARRTEPGLEYEEFAESLLYGDLVGAFWTAMNEMAKAAEAPLENRAARRKRTPASKRASKSATTSTPSTSDSSTDSPSESSPPQSKSSTEPIARNSGN